jgi:hypothetical protein
MRQARPKWDVFISHASEDKASVARPLAELLRSYGLRIWYDEFTFQVGDSLRKSIDAGLLRSRYAVVILSKDFLRRRWTDYELRGLIAKEMSGSDLILPVWHNIGAADVRTFSLPIADKFSLSTASLSVEEIARQIVAKVRPKMHLAVTHWIASFSLNTFGLRDQGSLPDEAPEDYATLCDWLMSNLSDEIGRSIASGRASIQDFRIVEDQRDGEMFSVRIAFRWKPDGSNVEFGVSPIWELVELLPYDEVYSEHSSSGG